jgi:molybdopterin-guanine dinucleotide biosynthesis protein A
MIARNDTVTGVLLAGGKGRRMDGRDKGLVEVAGRLMIEHAIARFRPQVDELVIVANRNLEVYRSLGYNVLNDRLSGYAGPLAGIAAALSVCTSSHIAVAPCDSPFMPLDLVDRLSRALTDQDAEISVARAAERLQPVFALLRASLRLSLNDYLDTGGRKIDTWYERHKLVTVDFSSEEDAFMNINTPEHQALAEALLRSS